jgi:hypothetical protein
VEPYWSSVVIRLANAGDRGSLQTLAELDSADRPLGQTLVGELGNQVVAALSLDDEAAIANPFVQGSHDILELLRLRAAQLRGEARARSPRLLSRRRR